MIWNQSVILKDWKSIIIEDSRCHPLQCTNHSIEVTMFTVTYNLQQCGILYVDFHAKHININIYTQERKCYKCAKQVPILLTLSHNIHKPIRWKHTRNKIKNESRERERDSLSHSQKHTYKKRPPQKFLMFLLLINTHRAIVKDAKHHKQTHTHTYTFYKARVKKHVIYISLMSWYHNLEWHLQRKHFHTHTHIQLH